MPGDADWSDVIIFYNMYMAFKNMKLCSLVLGYDTVQFCRWSSTYFIQLPVTFCVKDLGIYPSQILVTLVSLHDDVTRSKEGHILHQQVIPVIPSPLRNNCRKYPAYLQ